jgi:glucose-6-phosphate 1-dehydrogenase
MHRVQPRLQHQRLPIPTQANDQRDLAYKKIFPALQAMVKRGHLDVPVIGVAKAGWNLEQLRERAYDSVEKYGRIDTVAFNKLCGLLRYVDGESQAQRFGDCVLRP